MTAENTPAIRGTQLWKPGQSGNPNGRPSHAALRAALKPHEAETLDRLLSLMRSADKDSVCLDAVKTILAYLHGKPESVQVDDLSDDEMLAVIMRRKEAQAEKQ